jgi:hypothetical protein
MGHTVEQWEAYIEAEAKRRGITVGRLWALSRQAEYDASPQGQLDRTMAEVREDMRRGAYGAIHSGNSSMPPRPVPAKQPRPTTQSIDGNRRPGQAAFDALMDEDDRQWRRDRAKQFGMAEPKED